MPPQKPTSIREKISAIRRRSAKEQKAHERREEVTSVVIQDLQNTGTLFKTPEGHFYFEKGEAPRLFPIEADSVALAALIHSRYGINSAEEAETWGSNAELLIERIFDSTYIPRFRSAVGMPMSAAHWPNLENRHTYGFVHVRLYRLQQFIDQLRMQ